MITAQTVLLANQRNDIDIKRRRMDASVLLVKAVGGGWDTTQLPSFSGHPATDEQLVRYSRSAWVVDHHEQIIPHEICALEAVAKRKIPFETFGGSVGLAGRRS